jgi:hypothetical protein
MKANIRQQGDRALSELAKTRKQGDRALTELAKTYELVRDELADRFEEVAGRLERIDTRAIGDQAFASTAAARRRAAKGVRDLQKMRPGRQRRSFPWGWVVLGGVTLGIAWLLYDQRRREMISGQVTQLGSRTTAAARSTGIASAVDEVMSRVRGQQTILDEVGLRTEVESAIADTLEGGLPEGLQVAVEGRTVYLRGTVDPVLADSAANQAQGVPGVAAVVNLTTPPQGVTGRPTSRRAGSG